MHTLSACLRARASVCVCGGGVICLLALFKCDKSFKYTLKQCLN